MYFNNVHILVYGLIGIIGLIVGKFCAWCNKRLPEKQKIFSKEFFEENKKGLEFNYVFMILTAVIYMFLLFKLGIKDTFLKNLDLIKYLLFYIQHIAILYSSFLLIFFVHYIYN